MSKAKISAWPWKIHVTHQKIEIEDANGQPVAVVWSREMRHGGHSKSRYMNARLLALAPKLLEECGNAMRVLWRIKNPNVGCTCTTDGHYCAVCTIRDLEGIVALAYEIPDEFTVDPWCHKETHDGRAIDPSGDRSLTPGEGEKPAPKPADHIGEANEMVLGKPHDVPEVIELWGRIHIGSGKIRVYASKAFAIKAQAGCRDADWVVMDQPLQPAPKPAAMVVKAPHPVTHLGLFTDSELRTIAARDSAWRYILASQGFTVADGKSTQH
jgi:hypothetical protein